MQGTRAVSWGVVKQSHPNVSFNEPICFVSLAHRRCLATLVKLPHLTAHGVVVSPLIQGTLRAQMLAVSLGPGQPVKVMIPNPETLLTELEVPGNNRFKAAATDTAKKKFIVLLKNIILQHVFSAETIVPQVEWSGLLTTVLPRLHRNKTANEKVALQTFIELKADGDRIHHVLAISVLRWEQMFLAEIETIRTETLKGNADAVASRAMLDMKPLASQITVFVNEFKNFYIHLKTPDVNHQVWDAGLKSVLTRLNIVEPFTKVMNEQGFRCTSTDDLSQLILRESLSYKVLLTACRAPQISSVEVVKQLLLVLFPNNLNMYEVLKQNWAFRNQSLILSQLQQQALISNDIHSVTDWRRERNNKATMLVLSLDGVPGALTKQDIQLLDTACGIVPQEDTKSGSDTNFNTNFSVERQIAQYANRSVRRGLVEWYAPGGGVNKNLNTKEADVGNFNQQISVRLGTEVPWILGIALANINIDAIGLMSNILCREGLTAFTDSCRLNNVSVDRIYRRARNGKVTLAEIEKFLWEMTNSKRFHSITPQRMVESLHSMQNDPKWATALYMAPELLNLMVEVVDIILLNCRNWGMDPYTRLGGESTRRMMMIGLEQLGRQIRMNNVDPRLSGKQCSNRAAVDVQNVVMRDARQKIQNEYQQYNYMLTRAEADRRNNMKNSRTSSRSKADVVESDDDDDTKSGNKKSGDKRKRTQTRNDDVLQGLMMHCSDEGVNYWADARLLDGNDCIVCLAKNVCGSSHKGEKAFKTHKLYDEVKQNPSHLDSVEKLVDAIKTAKEEDE